MTVEVVHDEAADARSAVHVGVYVSAARCLLTYVLAPAMGLAGGLFGAFGLLLQLLGSVTAIAGARRLWQLGHRSRVPYAVVATSTGVLSAALLFNLLIEVFR